MHGVKLFFFASLVLQLCLSPNIVFSCDAEEAQKIIDDVQKKQIAIRTYFIPTVRYEWLGNWNALSRAEQRKLALGLAGAEVCATGKGIVTRISYGGKDAVRVLPDGSIDFF